MARRHHYRRLATEPSDLDMTTFLNLMVALIPFLLVTAVFSRITIVELDLPSAASESVSEPAFRLEVIIREDGFELTNGSVLIAAIPKRNGEYDVPTLSRLALSLKQDYPDAEHASVLLEPNIAYEHLIEVMDAIRSAELPAPGDPKTGDATSGDPETGDAKPTRVALFTDIAVGDAP